MKSLLKICFLLGLLSALLIQSVKADHHEEASVKTATRAEFEEFCSHLEGRWNVDIIWINDWPGADAVRGETVKGHSRFTRILDGAGLEMVSMQGAEEVKCLWYYDAVKSQIRSLWITSGGSFFNGPWHKGNETTYGHSLGLSGQKDGQRIAGSVRWEFSKDFRSFTVRSQNITLAGSPLGELKDTYTKVSP